MTLRIRSADGVVETHADDVLGRLNFELLASEGRPVTLTTEDGRPIAVARQGRIEERDLVLAGSPHRPVAPAEEGPPSLETRPAWAWVILGALGVAVFLGAVIQTVANAAAGL